MRKKTVNKMRADRAGYLAQTAVTQKVQVGDAVFDAAAVILMEDRDSILEKLSRNEQAAAHTALISFKAPDSRARLAEALSHDYQLLCIILADGSTKYQCKPEHLPFAKEIGLAVDREALLRMPEGEGRPQ